MLHVGVIGYGYWGPNLVRNFAEEDGSQVLAVCDFDIDRLALAKKRYPLIDITSECVDLFKDPRIDAIVIATPVSSHFNLALQAIQAGKHVLVEKPLTETSVEALKLIEEADKHGVVLMVDHTFIYTGAVQKIKDLVDSGSIGDIYYYDSVRVNLGLFQHDVNVIWDLAVHDISIMDYVLPLKPLGVSATGMNHLAGQPENVAYITLFFDDRMIAHIHVNWLAPVKVRQTLVGGSEKMIVYNDLDPSEKVKVYDKGVSVDPNGNSVYQMLIGYRTGDMWAPQLKIKEALRTEAQHFIQCVEQNQVPITDGWAGFRVVQTLEAAAESMKHQGQYVSLDSMRVST